MKITFSKELQIQGTEIKHSDKTNKDYFSLNCIDLSNGEFVRIPCTEVTGRSVVDGSLYDVSIRCESFFNEPAKISGFRLFAYNIHRIDS